MPIYNMKLNLAKCAFNISARKFPGFMVTQRRIKVNPTQVKIILKTPAPNSKKELQCLTSRLASLGHFIVRFIDNRAICSSTKKCRLKTLPILSSLTSDRTYKPTASSHLAPVELIRTNVEMGNRVESIWDQVSATIIFKWADGAFRVFGFRLQSPTGELIEQDIRLSFFASNNEAEYETILTGLDFALILVATKLEIRSDSQIIVKQIQREYKANDECMARYIAIVEEHLKKLDEWIIKRGPREENRRVDALVEIVVTHPINEMIMLPIYIKVVPSITLELVCNTS
ncbi:hypothetical protein CK203_088209 [Vitis vinifera]|uniref:RNase H type-1 domain-containing protein n=1 Tax=Vitis vinifera TaxID=29760 RepID=A0A438FL09_VITVI|nr:hypothetical protein CK203_088209 [Vitis vinifera]